MRSSLLVTAALWLGGGQVWGGDERTGGVLEPALLEIVNRAHRGPPRTLRFRFYADASYRSNVVRWQDRVRGWLGDLNRVVTPAFGVHFEAESFHRWERPSARGNAQQAVDDLVALDAGAEVDWVVGLIAPLPLISTSIHEIGMAQELGRHIVMRGMADIEEGRVHAHGGLLDNDRSDQEKLYARRKWHKEMSVFLHEWGHTLGAPHSRDDTDFMCGSYSNHMRRFSGPTLGLLEVTLACRTAEPPVAGADCKALLDYLEHTQSPDWYAEEQQRAISFLRERSGPVKNAPAAGGGPTLSAAHAQAWNEALRLLQAAGEQDKAGERERALVSVAAAAEQIRPLPDVSAPLWLAVAQTYQQLGAVTRADEAMARAGSGPEVEATRTRLRQAHRQYGLGTPGAVPPEAEPSYTQTFDKLARAVGEGTPVNVELQAALTRYPGAPGLMLLSCEAELRAGRRRQAEKLCISALQAAPEMARGHYLMGILTLDAGRRGEGETHLKRAIELDPDERLAWHALGDVYRMAGKRQDLAALTEEYRKRFNARLP